MTRLLGSPFLWLAVFLVGIFVCAQRFDKAAERLDLKHQAEPASSPKVLTQARNALGAVVLTLAVLYLFYETSLAVALSALFLGSLYLWHMAYKTRVLPLIAGGLSQHDARKFTSMQLLWIAPLTVALALFLLRRYSTP